MRTLQPIGIGGFNTEFKIGAAITSEQRHIIGPTHDIRANAGRFAGFGCG
jgi:hypothetical protein